MYKALYYVKVLVNHVQWKGEKKMDAKEKQIILAEGQKYGITTTCEKYGISRTLYYRWLHRFEAKGIEGLKTRKAPISPKNRTPKDLEVKVLTLIRTYPALGPREIKYLLEEIEVHLSESAVYNIMKRHNLSRREQRMAFSRKKLPKSTSETLPYEDSKSGECWFFFLTACGHWQEGKPLYIYSIIDYQSRIACSRLYETLSMDCFEDLLTAAALPVAQNLGFQTKYLVFLEDAQLQCKNRNLFEEKVHEILHASGFDPELHFLKSDVLPKEILSLRESYTKVCLSSLMPRLSKSEPLSSLKIDLQREIRNYNLSHQMLYEDLLLSPLEFHRRSIGVGTILPLWAYMDRDY